MQYGCNKIILAQVVRKEEPHKTNNQLEEPETKIDEAEMARHD